MERTGKFAAAEPAKDAARAQVWGVATARAAAQFRREEVDVSNALHPR